jgi:hypothetical protein
MAVEYHTHTFPTATRIEAEAGLRDDVALSPASLRGAILPIAPPTGFVTGTVRLTVSSTAPLNPTVNDVWIDTT